MYDCLIVGGGVIGLSLAYELARHGRKVCLIDRQAPGREASWAGAGILPPANRRAAATPYDELRALSYELHADWAAALREATGIDTGYRRCGGLYLARGLGESAALRAEMDQWRRERIAVEEIAPPDIAEFEPALADVARGGTIHAAYSLPGEAQLRNPRHVQALAAACQARGVAIHADAEARGLAVGGGRLRAIVTNEGELAADQFCFAAGAWTPALLAHAGLEPAVIPIRGQMVLFRAARPPFSRIVNEGPRYLVPRDDGRVLAGSTEEDVGFDCRTTPEGTAGLESFARDLVPALREAPIERSWAGLRPCALRGHPYLGRVPGLENAFVAAGHYRAGLFLSTGTAVVMSCLMRGERPPIDLAPFRWAAG
jgi:glycine oxidase